VIALAIGMVMVSCGSGNSNKQSVTSNGSGTNNYNPKEHITAVPVNIDFVEDWMLPTDGVITEVKLENDVLGIYKIRIEGINKAQFKKYEKVLESKGMVKGFDKFSNDNVVIDFTKTYLRDKAEESVLTLRINKK
jgi:hypothetical protein